MDIYSTFNNSGIDDFESLISSSLSNDLSMEIGQIMGQMELNNASRESKTAKANIEKRDLDRFRSLEKSVGGIQSKVWPC